ncbi:PHF5-like protein-domain-containing protein [Lentinula detonsa]|uniref:PHF5-like protein-domain-containing protein n=1 Tax=Lentinula detonsa TaxID=2804962 RepID=A0AA38USP1_9AGAR|nr:PHF5-like protein-domain-containing protein [Lentinula detonsa]
MSKHHPDLIMCRRQPGIAIGRLCEKCDRKCPVCDSYVRPETLGISDAYYCAECTRLEKD